jgi:ABC-type hemin transport system ATPase subunit
MNDQHSGTIQQITGQVRSMFYLMDEPTTALIIQADGQTITARAYGQIALDLRALPGGATICATLHDAQLECAQIIAFTIIPS